MKRHIQGGFLAVSMLLVMLPQYTVRADESDIVLSEVMLNPVTGNDGRWIEICNVGTTPVDMTGWAIGTFDGFVDSADLISTASCPLGSNCVIPAGECWIAGISAANLTAEFSSGNYGVAYDSSKTLPTRVPGTVFGLNVYLATGASSGDVIDCYAWDNSSCTAPVGAVGGGRNYAPGCDGVNGTAQGASGSPPQPVTNVAEIWANGIAGGTPYQMINQHESGPTALSLQSFMATGEVPYGVVATVVLFMGSMMVLWMQRTRKSQACVGGIQRGNRGG